MVDFSLFSECNSFNYQTKDSTINSKYLMIEFTLKNSESLGFYLLGLDLMA